MAKQITNKPIKIRTNKVYPSNQKPYELMVERLTEGKNEDECVGILREFHESYTYLLICEYGYTSPWILTLQNAYQAEKENGLVGFVNAIIKDYPTFFDQD